jgi:hypothetical protein
MSPLALLSKLVEIECAIGVESNAALHEMVIEAQNQIFRMEREMAASGPRKAPERITRAELRPELQLAS